MRAFIRHRQVLLLLVASMGCGEPTGTERPVPVARVVVTPAIDSLFSGLQLRLQAALFDSAGRGLSGRRVTWASSDTTKGIVSDSGVVTARNPGSFIVFAASDAATGGSFLNSQQQVVALVLPDTFVMGLDHRVRFIADLRSAIGTHVSGRPLAWSSSDTTIARVDSAGLVMPLALGVTVIRASSGGLNDSTRVRIVAEPVVHLDVSAPAQMNLGRPDTVTALPADSAGRDAVGNAVSWSSSDTLLLRVAPLAATDRRGVLFGLRPGVVRVTTMAGARTAVDTITLILAATRTRFMQDTVRLPVGDVLTLPLITEDSLGGLHDPEYVNLQYSLNGGGAAVIVPNTDPPQIRGVTPGTIQLIGSAFNEAWTDTATVIVVPAGTRALGWTPQSRGVFDYDTIQVHLAWDTLGSGGTMPPPRLVTITSADTSIATARPDSFVLNDSATITVRAGRSGTAILTARTDSTLMKFAVVVFPRSPSIVRLSPRPASVGVGDSVTFTFTQDVPYPDALASSDTSKATIVTGGSVAFRSPGRVILRARSGTAADSLPIEVTTDAVARIDSVRPAVLTAGGNATLYGSGISPASAAVGVDGVPTQVTGGSSGIVNVTLPPEFGFPCLPSHEAIVVLTAPGVDAADSAPLAVADTVSLATGGVAEQPEASGHCVAVALGPLDALYRVGVTNTTSQPVSFDFGISGAPGGAPVAPSFGVTPTSAALPSSRQIDSLSRVARQRWSVLEANRHHAALMGSPLPALRASRAALGIARSPSATINGVAQIRIPRIDRPDYCASSTTIQARLVYSGRYSRIFEDVTAPLGGTMDSLYVAIGEEFDAADYPVLTANFGDPLRLDSLLDRSGKVTLVFSPVVNAYGVGALVTDCDFYPESIAPSSNTAEVVFGPVPTVAGSGFNAYTPNAWAWTIRAAIMREATHLTSYAEHFASGAPFEQPWLEEAFGETAVEIWARSFYFSRWKGDAAYSSSVYCDVRPSTPMCTGRPYAMFDAFALFYDYAHNHEQRTPLGPASATDASFVGSGWAYLRWAIDRYATSESAFLRSLVQETSLTGQENLSARTGHPAAEMLSDWFMAWTSQDLPGTLPMPPQYQFPSWNLTSIFAGMSADFPADFVANPSFPRTFSTGGSTFHDPILSVPPGGSAYFGVIDDAASPLIVHFTVPSGTQTVPGLRVQFFRVR